jgi:CobQ/CobB/MinD/ParA nucleotide binding domain
MTPKSQPPVSQMTVTTTPQLKSQQLIIFVGGSKGGPGKSTVARVLADILAQRQVKFTAIDSDTENAQLYRHYHERLEVQRLDLTDRETMVDFLRDLTVKDSAKNSLRVLSKVPEPLILVDLPSGAEGKLRGFEDDFGLLSVLDEIAWDITFVSVMSPIKDSINALRLLLDLEKEHSNTHAIAVQNLHFGEDRKFELFHRSEVKKVLQERGLLLAVNGLDPDTYGAIDEKDLPFREAAAPGSPLFTVNRGYVFKWLEKLEHQLQPAGAWLGL